MDIYKITIFIIQVRHDEGKIFDMLLEACHQRFPGVYFQFTIALILDDVKLCQFVLIYHNLSQFSIIYHNL